jgi:hypothetical protein
MAAFHHDTMMSYRHYSVNHRIDDSKPDGGQYGYIVYEADNALALAQDSVARVFECCRGRFPVCPRLGLCDDCLQGTSELVCHSGNSTRHGSLNIGSTCLTFHD